ncbi:hypothetical protein RVR34_11335 [Microcystis aeruginosa FBCC-A68]|uniref:hypothetical protein n=1 Tax=Microcystis aeruginosa TaxID=1126 RepID=UPI0009A14EEE|nr:hypothetical protein [Microcystis aeruginosa]
MLIFVGKQNSRNNPTSTIGLGVSYQLSVNRENSPHPTPYTLHPTPYTLHPTPHFPNSPIPHSLLSAADDPI